MMVIDIDETTEAGRRILRELAEHPEAGRTREFVIPIDEDEDELPLYTPERLRKMKEEMLAANPDGINRINKIPRDEDGNPTDTPWEVIRERTYNNLSEHYGVDLRML
jgi:hypothetical protein